MEAKKGGTALKVMLSLRYADFKEISAGVAAIVGTLGWVEGTRAMGFATRRQLAAMWSGEGLYPEKGKQCVWFKLHFLKLIYDYLQETRTEEQAGALFEAIAKAPTLEFIGKLIPPSNRLTKEYILNHLWAEMIPKDTNIVSEACPPKGDSASMRVTRCFINEVSRDIGLLPLADKLCYGDCLFWENYHPNITFSRTRTLVAGDPICDHTVTWTE
jgi:hypothetical protein